MNAVSTPEDNQPMPSLLRLLTVTSETIREDAPNTSHTYVVTGVGSMIAPDIQDEEPTPVEEPTAEAEESTDEPTESTEEASPEATTEDNDDEDKVLQSFGEYEDPDSDVPWNEPEIDWSKD